MTYQGICVVPIVRKSLATGLVQDIIQIDYFDSLIGYANRHGLVTVYLSKAQGIVYYDSYIKYELERPIDLDLWQSVVAEQVSRLCVQHMTPKVHLMCTGIRDFSGMIPKLKARGVQVETPILGYRVVAIPKALMIL